MTNIPSGARYGVLMVFPASPYVGQIYIDELGDCYVRIYNGSIWKSWVKTN